MTGLRGHRAANDPRREAGGRISHACTLRRSHPLSAPPTTAEGELLYGETMRGIRGNCQIPVPNKGDGGINPLSGRRDVRASRTRKIAVIRGLHGGGPKNAIGPDLAGSGPMKMAAALHPAGCLKALKLLLRRAAQDLRLRGLRFAPRDQGLAAKPRSTACAPCKLALRQSRFSTNGVRISSDGCLVSQVAEAKTDGES